MIAAWAFLLLLAGPCDGRVHDKLAHPLRPLPRPAPGAAYTDPVFGTRITRITAALPSEVIKPQYSTTPAWNVDASFLMLFDHGKQLDHVLYDGMTYQRLYGLHLQSPTDEAQVMWDPIVPYLLWYPSNYNAEPRLMYQYVTRTSDVAGVRHDFRSAPTNCPVGDWSNLLTTGSDPQYMGYGPRRLLGLKCGTTHFIYSITDDVVVSVAKNVGRTPVAAIVAPGEGLFQLAGHIFDITMHWQRQLSIPNPYSHANMGHATAGWDTWLSVNFDSPKQGSLVSYRLDTGEARVIIGAENGYPYPPSTTHISGMAVRAYGWAAVGIVGSHTGQTLLDNEILLANFETGEVCRVAHARTFAGSMGGEPWGYWSETHVNLSPDGSRVAWGSDWMGGDRVDTYVAQLSSPAPPPSPSATPAAPAKLRLPKH